MIYTLNGVLKEKLNESVIIDVNGVGYEVFLTGRDINSLIIDSPIFIYTQLIINDDRHSLFGFISHSSLQIFKLLRGVNGIGPKSALNILNAGEPKRLITAISEADKNFFKSVSGVGPKSALKIIVELQDKVGKLRDLDLTPKSRQESEILDALESMGYNRESVELIVSKLDSNLSEKDKIKEVIKLMSANNA